MRRTQQAFFLLAFAAVGLVACHQPDVAISSGSPAPNDCPPTIEDSIGCGTYRSVEATEAGIAVEWVSDATFSLEGVSLNDTPTLVVGTPCNTLNVPVTIDTAVLHPGAITSLTAGCDPERTAQQRWVEDLLGTDVRWERTSSGLALHGQDGAFIEFTAD